MIPRRLRAYGDTYRNGIHSYLDGIHERLVLARELLTDTGSLFLQIGDDNVHLLGVLCDEVFGTQNRMATITYATSGGGSSTRSIPAAANYLLWYAKDKTQAKYRPLYEPLSRKEIIEYFSWHVMVELADGTTRPPTPEERADPRNTPTSGLASTGGHPLRRQACRQQDGPIPIGGTVTTGRVHPASIGVCPWKGWTASPNWAASTPPDPARSCDGNGTRTRWLANESTTFGTGKCHLQQTVRRPNRQPGDRTVPAHDHRPR